MVRLCVLYCIVSFFFLLLCFPRGVDTKRRRDLEIPGVGTASVLVWLRALRLSARGPRRETQHAVISVTSLAAGTRRTPQRDATPWHISSNCPHFYFFLLFFLTPALDTWDQSCSGDIRKRQHTRLWVHFHPPPPHSPLPPLLLFLRFMQLSLFLTSPRSRIGKISVWNFAHASCKVDLGISYIISSSLKLRQNQGANG